MTATIVRICDYHPKVREHPRPSVIPATVIILPVVQVLRADHDPPFRKRKATKEA